MSKKDALLTEGQVRQFMKLANLKPLTPGFIIGVHEARKNAKGGEELESTNQRGHGRGREPVEEGHGTKKDEEKKTSSPGRGEKKGDKAYVNERARLIKALLEQFEEEEEELGLDVDLGPEGDLGVEDVGVEELGVEEEELGGGQQVSVDDFLAALEVALEEVLGDEVEVEQEEDELGDLEVEDVGVEDIDVEEEEPLELQEMVNFITRRVAKRIVKEALNKK